MDSFGNDPTRPIGTPSRATTSARTTDGFASKRSRRQSVVDRFEFIRHSLHQLTHLWDEVYMSEETRIQRMDVAFKHIETLVDDMIESETRMVDEAKRSINDGLKEIELKRMELEMDAWICTEQYPSIALLKAVEKELKTIRIAYNERKEEQDNLCSRIETLALRLGDCAAAVLPSEKRLLTKSEQRDLEACRDAWEESYRKKLKIALALQADFAKWKKAIVSLIGVVDLVNAMINCDLEEDDFILSDDVMKKLDDYHNEFSHLYNDWISDRDMAWRMEYMRLCELWDHCHINIQDRTFGDFDADRYSDEEFQAMKDEIKRLEAVYESRRPVYEIIDTFKQVWQQKLDLDDKRKFPSYYQSRDRSNNVLNDLKHEKYVNSTLSETQKKLAAVYADHIAQYPDDEIKIDGIRISDYVEWVKAERKLATDAERAMLKEKKNTVNVNSTPRPRGSRKTPASTPLPPIPGKHRRLNGDQDNTLAPEFVPGRHEMPSLITPTRPHERGPKTSSPKQYTMSPRKILQPPTPLRRQN